MKRYIDIITGRKCALASLLMAAFAPMSALAVSPTGDYSVTFTVSGYQGSTSLENFPVLVRLKDDSPTAFHYVDCAADGLDIYFTDASGNALAHEIDTWNISGESLIWVKIPSVTPVAQGVAQFTMHYGTVIPAGITLPAASSVWSSGYKGVWHLCETGAGGTSANSTAVGSALNGSNHSSTVDVVGKVGRARQISDSTDTKNGKTGVILVDGKNEATDFNGVFTISGWFWHKNQAYYYDHLFYKRIASKDAAGGIAIEMADNKDEIHIRGGDSASDAVVAKIATSTFKETWSLVTFVYNDTTVTLYQDGEFKGRGTIAKAVDNKLNWAFGNNANGSDISWKGRLMKFA